MFAAFTIAAPSNMMRGSSANISAGVRVRDGFPASPCPANSFLLRRMNIPLSKQSIQKARSIHATHLVPNDIGGTGTAVAPKGQTGVLFKQVRRQNGAPLRPLDC